MLLGLSIRNVVLIDRLDLTFQRGLSVLTGETGAGKSILLDALGLALGARSDSTLVRHGTDQATVSAEFAVPEAHPVRALLAEQALDVEGNLLLRRQVGSDGRSRAFINDHPVSVGLLKQVGDGLVEIEGQFEQHGLMDAATHRGLLDAYGGLRAAAGETAEAWRAWRRLQDARAEAEADLQRAQRDEAFLRHALGELDALDPKPNEEAALSETRSLLMHRGQVIEAMQAALAELSGDRGADAALASAQRRLDRIAAKAGSQIEPILAALDRAAAEIADATAELQRLSADPDLDPRRLEQVEDRLFALRDLSRKHDTPVDDLIRLREDFSARLASVEDQGGLLERLAKEETVARQAYVKAATALNKRRVEAARRLDAAINTELPPLKLEKATFRTAVERLEESQWSEAGLDRVAFEVSTNPGTPPGPLGRIASGGELARFMLALKVVLATADPVPTLVFDEVDSGVGGATAAAVGERLARLADEQQVLVITHSPQVAALGAHHWRVQKTAGKTAPKKDKADRQPVLTQVEALEAADRREEIARMLSGATITDEARAAADRLMAGREAVS
ncbi:DNA repair protein RecN [Rhodospirillaceae bacterium SYSU D60014]|uniref:DNA repair protein RecN n=1 Tax=Virgifigura deserti TaxID=2268457 RepID=UPI000E672322